MFDNNSGQAAHYSENDQAACPRCYTDNPSINNLFYRESEAAAKISHMKAHLRDNAGAGDILYTTVHHPLCFCEEHQTKTYNAE